MRIPPSSRPGLLPAALACLAVAASPAAEHRIDDVYVTAEWRSADFSFDWRDSAAARSGDDRYRKAYAVGGGWRWGWGGSGSPHHLLTGIGGLGLREEFAGGIVTGAMLRLEAGYGLGVSDRLLLAVLPVADLGLTRTSLAVDRGAPLVLDGSLIEYGLRAGARWSPSSAWALSADLGWISGSERSNGDGAELRIRRSGPIAAITLLWRLDDRPRPLE